MKYKKGLIFIFLLLFLFTVASVVAADVNETVVASEDQSELITVEVTDEIVKYDNQNDGNISLDDNITTDHIMPAGAKVLPYRSNIEKISEFVFSNIDPFIPF